VEFELISREGLASPIGRMNVGFVGYGRTAGGAREWVIPNLPVSELPIRIVNIRFIYPVR